MATIIKTGGGYSVGYDDGRTDGYSQGYTDGYKAAEIFDGYTLFMCLIGSKWGAKSGDGDSTNRRILLRGIDMTRVKSISVTQTNSSGYDYFQITTTASNDKLFFHRGAGTFDIDFASMDADKKKSMVFETFSAGETYVTINSVTKAE